MPREKQVQGEIRVALELDGFEVIKIHGNLYQSGLPDLLVTSKRTGRQFWIEVKVGKCRDGVHLINKLKGRQTLLICRWGMRNVPVFIAGGWTQPSDAGWWLGDVRTLKADNPAATKIHRFKTVDELSGKLAAEFNEVG